MADKLKGEVKVIRKNDHGFYSVKIDDTWYGTGKKEAPAGISQGDIVEGEYELEKGKYKTVTKAGLVKAAKSAESTGGSSSGLSKDEWAMKDLRIQYQHAQKVAATLIANPAIQEAAGVTKAKPDAKMGILAALFDKFTAEVFADIATFGAVSRNAGETPSDPSAPPADDSDDE